MSKKKLQVWFPLIFSLVMIAGMYFGFRLRENTPSDSPFFKADRKSTLQQIMDLVRKNYVDSVQTDTLQYDAIQELMNNLDPHSVFIPASQLEEMNEDIIGNFDGIGIEFNIFNDTINVLYVMPGGPSDKAGLDVGDKIIKVDSLVVAGKQLTTDQIKKLMKGEKGSGVELTALRNGSAKTFDVTRGSIPLPAVDAAYMLDGLTGYIKLSKFSETAHREVAQSLENLNNQGMKKLIFDLRGNVGGFMNQAVDIVDEFLDGDKLVVYTEGTNVRRKDYKCRKPGLFEQGELVVLIDELSASASEVVAGSLQDWCRAKIIGRRSFGKGLVQEQYELTDGSAVRLTVARYYLPQNRSIQRPYDHGKKVYLDEIWERYSNGEVLNADSIKINNGKIYKTVCGDTVYGGGGIMPDIFVPIDTSRSLSQPNGPLFNREFNNLVYTYYINHRKEIDSFGSVQDFLKNYKPLQNAWSYISDYVSNDSINPDKVSARDKSLISDRFKANLVRYKWRNNGFYEVVNLNDNVIKKAVSYLEKTK